jgi:hypothetical protein
VASSCHRLLVADDWCLMSCFGVYAIENTSLLKFYYIIVKNKKFIININLILFFFENTKTT